MAAIGANELFSYANNELAGSITTFRRNSAGNTCHATGSISVSQEDTVLLRIKRDNVKDGLPEYKDGRPAHNKAIHNALNEFLQKREGSSLNSGISASFLEMLNEINPSWVEKIKSVYINMEIPKKVEGLDNNMIRLAVSIAQYCRSVFANMDVNTSELKLFSDKMEIIIIDPFNPHSKPVKYLISDIPY